MNVRLEGSEAKYFYDAITLLRPYSHRKSRFRFRGLWHRQIDGSTLTHFNSQFLFGSQLVPRDLGFSNTCQAYSRTIYIMIGRRIVTLTVPPLGSMPRKPPREVPSLENVRMEDTKKTWRFIFFFFFAGLSSALGA